MDSVLDLLVVVMGLENALTAVMRLDVVSYDWCLIVYLLNLSLLCSMFSSILST